MSLTRAAACADVHSASLRKAYFGAERAMSDDFIVILVNTTDVSPLSDDTIDHLSQSPNPKNHGHGAAAPHAYRLEELSCKHPTTL